MSVIQSGFLAVYKPAGITTYDTIRIVKKRTGFKKIGHTGTLDPFAEGIVVLLVGQMTRLFSYFSLLSKKYRAFAEFGKTTDTLDITGNVTDSEAHIPDIDTIKNNLHFFTGEIIQTPPAFSAVHVNGIRAYELARKGIVPEIKKKTVTVHSLSLNSYDNNVLVFDVACSSGTYIRTLAFDLANKCSSSAYLLKLIRTAIGNFTADNSKLPHEIVASDLMPVQNGFEVLGIPVIIIDGNISEKILKGQDILKDLDPTDYPGQYISFFSENSNFLALVDNREFSLKYAFVSADT